MVDSHAEVFQIWQKGQEEKQDSFGGSFGIEQLPQSRRQQVYG